MITYYFRTLKDDVLKEIPEGRRGVWVHVESPTSEEVTELIERFKLNEAILEDAQDFFEVPRVEKEDGITYFFTRYPYDEPSEDTESAPLMIVVGETFLMTFVLRPVPQFSKFFDGTIEIHTTQKAKLFIQIMNLVTISYEKELVRLRRVVHKDRAKIRRLGNAEIVRFVNYEHKLNDMISSVMPTNNWIQLVTKGNYIQLYEQDVEFMEDLMIDNNQLVDSARSVLKTIQNVRTATEAIMTNNLNSTIRTLTVLTIILTVPTIIASLYGMNVTLPFGNHPWGFWIVLTFIFSVISFVTWAFKKNKWL